MKEDKKKLSLRDMDLGLFLSYEVNGSLLITKLFHIITLNSIELNDLKDFRRADDTEIPRLNRLNWFSMPSLLCPIYTLQSSKRSRRIFMRLDYGSHIDMQKMLG